MLSILELRATWLRRVRAFFDNRGFLEVQTPVLSRDTVVDRYIEPIPVDIELPGCGEQRFYLQTSPEFCLKRLLAAGAQAIYEITPAFRLHEQGPRHNLEFTMVEWYRVGDDYRAGIDLLDQFAQELLDRPPAQRIPYRELFLDIAGCDPFADGGPDAGERQRILAEIIEPALNERPSVIVYDWPAEDAALAKIRQEPPLQFAERFELYIDGIELANGYHELTDADELLLRNQRVNQLRKRDGRPQLPETSRLLTAMREGLPAGCGVALGFDRLVMIAAGATSVREVIPCPDNVA